MLTINQYINEEVRKFPLWCEIVLSMFKDGKSLTKEIVSIMLNNFCSIEGRLKKFSDYLADTYPKEYLPYQPNDDDFLNKENDKKNTDQIAEFIIKTII